MKRWYWLIVVFVFFSTHALSRYLYSMSLNSKELNLRVEGFVKTYNSYTDFISYLEYKNVDPKVILEFQDNYSYELIKELNFIGLCFYDNSNRMDKNLLIVLKVIYKSNRVSVFVKDKIKKCDVLEYKGICHLESYFESK